MLGPFLRSSGPGRDDAAPVSRASCLSAIHAITVWVRQSWANRRYRGGLTAGLALTGSISERSR